MQFNLKLNHFDNDSIVLDLKDNLYINFIILYDNNIFYASNDDYNIKVSSDTSSGLLSEIYNYIINIYNCNDDLDDNSLELRKFLMENSIVSKVSK